VLRADPDWQALPAQTPERVREILERCLEKDLGRRRRDIGDVRHELEKELHGTPKTEPVTASEPRQAFRWRRAMLWTFASVALAVFAATAFWSLRPAVSLPVMRLNMNVSPADQLTGYN
jgi:uncharacterized membrane protein YccC